MGEHAGPVAAPGGRVPARPGRMAAPGGVRAAPPARLIAQLEQWRGHRGWWRVHRGWLRGHMVRVMADGTTNRTRHRVVTARMVLVSALVGVVLAVASVPVGKIVSNRVLRTPNTQAGKQQFWLDRGDHQIYVYHWRDPFRAHWESSIVPLGMYGEPEPEFERPAFDPRPMYARRAFTGHVQSIVSASAGWPWLAAQGRAVMDGTPSMFWDEGTRPVKLGPVFMHLPYRPIWLGLLANTLFYAAIIFGLLVALRSWRTRRRRARGRCVACGYELGKGVGVCPECGLAARPLAKGG